MAWTAQFIFRLNWPTKYITLKKALYKCRTGNKSEKSQQINQKSL